MKRAFVDIDEGQVHYRTEGIGEVLLLLHQMPYSSSDYAEVIPILSKKYRVIAMDMLGYGDSDRPPRQYSLEEYTKSIVSFLDALKVKKVNVVGHHVGATMACELAVAYPDRVIKAVLSCTCCYNREERQEMMKNYVPAMTIEIKADGSHLMKVWQMAMERFPASALDIAHDYTLSFLKTGMGEHTEAAHRALYNHDPYPNLRMIECPTLLLWADKGRVYPHADRVNELVKNKQVKIIKGGTNFYHRLRPQEFAQAVLDFLDETK